MLDTFKIMDSFEILVYGLGICGFALVCLFAWAISYKSSITWEKVFEEMNNK